MEWDNLRPLLLRVGVPSNLLARVHDALRARARARPLALSGLSSAVNGDAATEPLLSGLAAADDRGARRLALELAAVLPPRLKSTLVAQLRPLLRDRRVPAAVRLRAAVALTRSTGPRGAATVRVLRDFAAGVGKSRTLERATALRRRFGDLPAFGPFLAYLRTKVKLRCPRCRDQLPRRAMVRHLWHSHGLLLVGRRLATPERLIDAWSTTADPERGLLRLHRWMARQDLDDDEARNHLRRAADRRGVSLCPKCWALVPRPPHLADPAPAPLLASHGRLSGEGFVVQVTEDGAVPRLLIQTPRGPLFDGPEPGAQMASRAQRIMGIGPWLALAGACAAFAPAHLALLLTAAALTAAVATAAALRGLRRPSADRLTRAVDHAWVLLAPHLPADPFDPAGAAFVARLALTSLSRGTARLRKGIVERLADATARALHEGRARPADLAVLVRLRIADADATGDDAVACLANAIRPCLTGDVPLSVAELALADELPGNWTPGRLARLRVLLAARAFEAGLEPLDLYDLGRAAPALSRALGADDLDSLARLRLLWTLRPSRPWLVCGPAATVFELANYPMLGSPHFESAPDLLLYQPLPASGGEPLAPLLVCGRGLLYRDVLVYSADTPIDATAAPGRPALTIGRHTLPFRGDPRELARKLNRWVTFFFKEFLPQTEAVLRARSGLPPGLLRGGLATSCPHCGAAIPGRPTADA